MTKKRMKLWAVLVGTVAVLGVLAGCARATYELPKTLTAMSIPQGRSATQKITITRTGNFKGEIEFSVTGAPTGMTAKFDPVKTTPTGTETTLTLTVGEAVAVQKYTLKVVATRGKTKKEVPLEVTVQVKPDFTLATAPTALTVKQGATGTVAITLTRSATLTGPVALTLEGAPAGVSGTFSPASVTGTTSTLTLSVATTAAAGTYSLTVRGRGDGVDKTATVRLTVEALPDFSLILSPTAVSLKPGETRTVAITLARVGGFVDAVDLTAEGLPTDVTAAFDPRPAPGGSATLTLSAGPTAAAGTYVVVIRGVGGGKSKTATLTLTIAP